MTASEQHAEYADAHTPTVHHAHDGGLTPCCGRTLFELPRTDMVTQRWSEVTCGRAHAPTIGAKIRAAIEADVLRRVAERGVQNRRLHVTAAAWLRAEADRVEGETR